jgi:hypothetical protein
LTEQERADMLARAVDHLIHPNRNPPTPPSRTDRDLDALVDVAASRATAGNMLRLAAASSRAGVWRSVADRLGSQAEAPAQAGELSDADAAELAGVITARRDVSEHVLWYARTQQAEVWSAVTARLKAAGMAFETEPARRTQPEAETPGRRVRSHHSLATDNSVARRHATDETHHQATDWATRRRKLPDGIAGILAAMALFVAAIGPLPATGLADHPAAVAVRELTSHLAVAETQTAPPNPIGAENVAAADVLLDEAQRVSGLPVLAPQVLPDGYTLETSRYYATPLSAEAGGVFVLNYVDASGSAIDIFQESASGADVAAPVGAPVGTFVGGSPATYLAGAWSAASGTLAWEPGGTQTIVFESAGVRTTIRYTGRPVSPQELLDIGDDLAAQRTR